MGTPRVWIPSALKTLYWTSIVSILRCTTPLRRSSQSCDWSQHPLSWYPWTLGSRSDVRRPTYIRKGTIAFEMGWIRVHPVPFHIGRLSRNKTARWTTQHHWKFLLPRLQWTNTATKSWCFVSSIWGLWSQSMHTEIPLSGSICCSFRKTCKSSLRSEKETLH